MKKMIHKTVLQILLACLPVSSSLAVTDPGYFYENGRGYLFKKVTGTQNIEWVMCKLNSLIVNDNCAKEKSAQYPVGLLESGFLHWIKTGEAIESSLMDKNLINEIKESLLFSEDQNLKPALEKQKKLMSELDYLKTLFPNSQALETKKNEVKQIESEVEKWDTIKKNSAQKIANARKIFNEAVTDLFKSSTIITQNAKDPAQNQTVYRYFEWVSKLFSNGFLPPVDPIAQASFHWESISLKTIDSPQLLLSQYGIGCLYDPKRVTKVQCFSTAKDWTYSEDLQKSTDLSVLFLSAYGLIARSKTGKWMTGSNNTSQNIDAIKGQRDSISNVKGIKFDRGISIYGNSFNYMKNSMKTESSQDTLVINNSDTSITIPADSKLFHSQNGYRYSTLCWQNKSNVNCYVGGTNTETVFNFLDFGNTAIKGIQPVLKKNGELLMVCAHTDSEIQCQSHVSGDRYVFKSVDASKGIAIAFDNSKDLADDDLWRTVGVCVLGTTGIKCFKDGVSDPNFLNTSLVTSNPAKPNEPKSFVRNWPTTAPQVIQSVGGTLCGVFADEVICKGTFSDRVDPHFALKP